MELKTFQNKWRPKIQQQLEAQLQQDVANKTLREAVLYAVLAGGKRLRPLLTLAVIDSLGDLTDDMVVPACAIELIHSYSLIHDDLPAMDNDLERRGQPTTHVKFGEAIAILAGDALQPLAFQWLSTAPHLTVNQKAALVEALAKAAGPNGMVGGQVLDMQATGANQINLAKATQIHEQKTGALIRYALVAGGIMAGSDRVVLKALDAYGAAFGLAFQIKDDLDDLKQDGQADKQAYPEILGVEAATEALRQAVETAKRALDQIAEYQSVDLSLLQSFLQYFDTTLEK